MGGSSRLNLLLDTHIWIWALDSSQKLNPGVRRTLRKEPRQLWLSPISVWETLLLASKGRITLQPNGPDWVSSALQKVPLNEAPLTHEIAIESRRLKNSPEDPADRFLIATARILRLTLLTSDQSILDSKACATLANT